MNRWYFWALAPVFVLSAAIIATATEPPTLFGWAVQIWVQVMGWQEAY